MEDSLYKQHAHWVVLKYFVNNYVGINFMISAISEHLSDVFYTQLIFLHVSGAH